MVEVCETERTITYKMTEDAHYHTLITVNDMLKQLGVKAEFTQLDKYLNLKVETGLDVGDE